MNYFILALIINVNFAQKITLSGHSDTLSVYAVLSLFFLGQIQESFLSFSCHILYEAWFLMQRLLGCKNCMLFLGKDFKGKIGSIFGPKIAASIMLEDVTTFSKRPVDLQKSLH